MDHKQMDSYSKMKMDLEMIDQIFSNNGAPNDQHNHTIDIEVNLLKLI